MAKKKSVKRARVVKTEVYFNSKMAPARVLESYTLIKRRLNDIYHFIEFTYSGGLKVIVNKKMIRTVRPLV